MKSALITIALFFSIFLAGCSGTSTIKVSGVDKEIPDWVLKPDNIKDRPGVFYGVGSANTNSMQVSMETADAAAKRVIQLKMESRDKTLVVEQSNTSSGVAQQTRDMNSRSETDGIVRGVRIIERYASKDGTWFSLAVLDTTRSDSGYESELKK